MGGGGETLFKNTTFVFLEKQKHLSVLQIKRFSVFFFFFLPLARKLATTLQMDNLSLNPPGPGGFTVNTETDGEKIMRRAERL